MRGILVWVVLVTAIMVTLAGCTGAQPEKVEVTLTEFGVETPMTTFKVGQPYQFVITNDEAIPHEFVIMRPLEEGEMNMAGHGMEESLVTVTVDYTFTEPMTAGALEFACHLSGHYAAGMKMPVTVAP